MIASELIAGLAYCDTKKEVHIQDSQGNVHRIDECCFDEYSWGIVIGEIETEDNREGTK